MNNVDNYLENPQQVGQTRKGTEIFVFCLILWILDHASLGNGNGFPFDQRYLYCYKRLRTAHAFLNRVKSYYSTRTENDKVLWELYHQIQKIVADRKLKNTFAIYQKKLRGFQIESCRSFRSMFSEVKNLEVV